MNGQQCVQPTFQVLSSYSTADLANPKEGTQKVRKCGLVILYPSQKWTLEMETKMCGIELTH